MARRSSAEAEESGKEQVVLAALLGSLPRQALHHCEQEVHHQLYMPGVRGGAHAYQQELSLASCIYIILD